MSAPRGACRRARRAGRRSVRMLSARARRACSAIRSLPRRRPRTRPAPVRVRSRPRCGPSCALRALEHAILGHLVLAQTLERRRAHLAGALRELEVLDLAHEGGLDERRAREPRPALAAPPQPALVVCADEQRAERARAPALPRRPA